MRRDRPTALALLPAEVGWSNNRAYTLLPPTRHPSAVSCTLHCVSAEQVSVGVVARRLIAKLAAGRRLQARQVPAFRTRLLSVGGRWCLSREYRGWKRSVLVPKDCMLYSPDPHDRIGAQPIDPRPFHPKPRIQRRGRVSYCPMNSLQGQIPCGRRYVRSSKI
ncbi:hypothetical protein DFP72DRAFT_462219 [Ephemerocybe angulata]|uniref:Uncharacterized protein n=1 Tax=Ephemerocybe angulata TaxID=980116 RepID=A0A8H6HSM5_9AGAR|nr:hypothetical protein DFP72DRAFT_462219 [Tulosesus angulatus]